MYNRKEIMKKLKNVEEINPHGYKIIIYHDENKVKIYNHDNIPTYDFKSISDREINWLMSEGFIEKKKIRVEIATITPTEESNEDSQVS
jgi:hypothetical protein